MMLVMVVTHPPKVRRNSDNISRNEPRLEMVGETYSKAWISQLQQVTFVAFEPKFVAFGSAFCMPTLPSWCQSRKHGWEGFFKAVLLELVTMIKQRLVLSWQQAILLTALPQEMFGLVHKTKIVSGQQMQQPNTN